MMKKLIYLAVSTILVCCSCNGKDNPENNGTETPTPVVNPDAPGAKVYTTTFDASRKMEQTNVAFGKAASMSPNVVRFTSDRYQTIDGFGLAVTQAACYNLLKMPEEDRTRILTEIFSPTDGYGSSLIRVCIGGSDFSMDEYTWCDTEGISNFKIHPSEEQYLFPVLDEIYKINPSVRIIGSPWSCPRWMKMKVDGTGTHYSWTSGRLDPKYYSDYATYFVKWIQAMEARGYKVAYVTLQNEPLNHGNSMSLYMPWEDQRDFLKVAGPAFKAAGVAAEILLFDHNYNYDNNGDNKDYPLKIFADGEASQWAAGSAWHNYGGSVKTLDGVFSAYPEKKILFTEASIGKWNYDGHGFGGQLREDFREIVFGTLSRGCSGVTLWNLMLDNEGKPYRPGGCSTCYGGVSISASGYSFASIDRKSHYYDVVHTSVAVKPGAVRIGTEGYTATGVQYLAFLNPDGSYGVLILNESSASQNFVFSTSAHSVNIPSPAGSVVSAVWKD